MRRLRRPEEFCDWCGLLRPPHLRRFCSNACKIAFQRQQAGCEDRDARDAELRASYEELGTLKKVGERHGLSKERVRQRIKRSREPRTP
jgi:hypothetical protein